MVSRAAPQAVGRWGGGSPGPSDYGRGGIVGRTPRPRPPSPRRPGPASARGPCPPFASGYGTPASVSPTCRPSFSVTPEGWGGGEVTLKVRVPRESSCSTQPLKTRSYRRCRPAVCEVFATSLQLSGPSAEVDLNSWRAVGIGSRAWPSLTTRRLNGRA